MTTVLVGLLLAALITAALFANRSTGCGSCCHRKD